MIANIIALLTPQKVFIDTIPVNVLIRETMTDSTEITEHPVSSGSTITDHSYNLPNELTLEIIQGEKNWLTPNDSYSKLVTLKKSRKPFKIYTTKRLYDNMLIKNITTTVDSATYNVLSCTVTFREIIIAQVSLLTLDISKLKTPQITAPPSDLGKQDINKLEPKSEFSSALYKMMNGSGASNPNFAGMLPGIK